MPGDRWTGGDAYDRYVGRWSRSVAPLFIDWLGAPRGARWLDVGCGTGAVTATILERTDPRSVVGVDPSEDFIALAARTIEQQRARFVVGDAAALPVADGSIDAAVAGLVLNHVADPSGVLTEMRRVVMPGGVVGAYVWDYAGRMDLIRLLWDAAVALDPTATSLDQGVTARICAPGPLRDAFATAGLHDVEVDAIDVPTPFRDIDDYWTPFLAGVGEAPRYVVSLDPEARTALRDRLVATLPIAADGTIDLIARAWAVRART